MGLHEPCGTAGSAQGALLALEQVINNLRCAAMSRWTGSLVQQHLCFATVSCMRQMVASALACVMMTQHHAWPNLSWLAESLAAVVHGRSSQEAQQQAKECSTTGAPLCLRSHDDVCRWRAFKHEEGGTIDQLGCRAHQRLAACNACNSSWQQPTNFSCPADAALSMQASSAAHASWLIVAQLLDGTGVG